MHIIILPTMISRITNRLRRSTDVDPDNAIEDVLDLFKTDDEREVSANKEETNEHQDDPVKDEEAHEEVGCRCR